MADVAIFIGRFQPVHYGHMAVAKRALERHGHLIIGIGSSNRSRRTKNPFTFEERKRMWEKCFYHEGIDKHTFSFVALDDIMYSDNEWVAQVRHRVNEELRRNFKDKEVSVSLTGHEKDTSSYYLRFFPEWESDLIPKGFDTMEATRIRERFYKEFRKGRHAYISMDQYYGDEDFRGLPAFSPVWDSEYQRVLMDLADEWDFDQGYDPSKFPVNVLTVDAVVVQNGHVLTVRRKNLPGKGLMALPGGHMEPGETLQNAMLRELREETRIDLSDRVLRANIRNNEVFDDPGRSTRARVVTQAYLIHLPDEPTFVKVKGADDAESAFWTPLSEVRYEDWFEDHAAIVERMCSYLR